MLALIAACTVVTGTKLPTPIAYEKFKYGRATFHVVTADMNSGRVVAETVIHPKLTSIATLISRAKPSAAITGTFFGYNSQKPVADVLVNGELKSNGSIGSAIGVDWVGNVHIFDLSYRKKIDWSLYRFGVRGTVRIVSNGAVQPNPRAQRFKDSRIWGRAARTGVGLTKSGKLLMVATTAPVTLSELGKAMKSRGVSNAVSLDGGGSTCLYYKGSYKVATSRKLNNLFVLKESDAFATTQPMIIGN